MTRRAEFDISRTTPIRGLWRSRWAAIGAAVAVTFGGGGLMAVSAGADDGVAYHPMVPVRVLDTRIGTGAPAGALGAGQTLTLEFASAGVPAAAESVTFNLTVVDGTEGSFLTVYPAGEARSVTSSLNWSGANAVANQVRARLGTGNAVKIYNLKGTVNVVADLVGYSTLAGAGTDGVTGATGAKGAVGTAGAIGAAGAKGDKGDKGDAVVYSGKHWGLIDRNTMGSPVGALRSGPYEGASTPPLGDGSLGFSVKDGTEKVTFGNEIDFFGDSVKAITAVGFQVFWTGEDKAISPDNLPNITFEVDPTGSVNTTGPNYSSMVFVPFGAALPTNTFNAIDATSDAAGWWYFTNGATATATACGQSNQCSFSDLQAAIVVSYPEMSVLTLAIGKGRDSAWNGAIDALRYNESVYDFEPFGVFTLAA